MIFHLSISAADPQRAARVIAELWNGAATPFPPVHDGSWIAMAGDPRNSAIEVYPAGAELAPGEGDADADAASNPAASLRTATHAAIATPLSREAVFAIAAREGWLAKYRKRGGVFGVIEFWIENNVMLEVLPDDMQREYLAGMTVPNWLDLVASGGPAAARAEVTS